MPELPNRKSTSTSNGTFFGTGLAEWLGCALDILGGFLKWGNPKTMAVNTKIVWFWIICGYPFFRTPPYAVYYSVTEEKRLKSAD